MTEAELKELVAKAKSRYDAMSPAEKEWHDHEQRRSFVRGQCPDKRDYDDWCKTIDRLLPPKQRPQEAPLVERIRVLLAASDFSVFNKGSYVYRLLQEAHDALYERPGYLSLSSPIKARVGVETKWEWRTVTEEEQQIMLRALNREGRK